MQSRKNIKKTTKIINEIARLRRLASDANLDSIIQIEYSIQIFSQNPQISLSQLKILLKHSKFEIEDRDYQNLKISKIDFMGFINFIKQVKENQKNRQDINQILNAFVALGGNSDKSGRIQKSILVNIIRNQFQLTFGIQEFLDKTTEGTYLEYDTFAQIFAQTLQQPSSSRSRIGSSLSLKLPSVPTAQIGQQGATTRIHYSEFQNWLQQSKS